MATNDQVSKGIPTKVETPAAEVSPPSLDTYAIQRRGTRVLIQERAPVQLHLRAGELLEISRSGALVEHTIGVRVGEVYRLLLPVQGLDLEVLARAVRSSVAQVAPVAGGEGQIVYRTGLEFVELKETVAKALSAYVDDVHQQTAGSRLTQPAAKAPEDRTRVPIGAVPGKGVVMRQHGKASAIPANPLTVPDPEQPRWSRWAHGGVLILASVLLSSLLYQTAAHTTVRWIFARDTVAGIAGPVAPKTNPGGEQASTLLAGAAGLRESELASLGLVQSQPGPQMLLPNESMAAGITGPSAESARAGAAADLSLSPSVVSSILGLRVSVPQRFSSGDRSESQPQVIEETVRPATPQSPVESPMPQAGSVPPDPSPPSPGTSQTSNNLVAAVPQPMLMRPKDNSQPSSRDRAMPSVRVPSPTPPPVPREDKAPRKGMNLPGADLRGADLRGANLQGADLTGARLAWARLTGAKLQGATLQGADLSEADLWMADLRGADLQKADLRGAKLTPGEQAAREEESAGEAISMIPAPGEARSEIPVEILDPRRIVAERPREDEPR